MLRRYRDKDRSNSPSTTVDNNVVTSAPTFKSDDKKPISVKASVTKSSAATTVAASAATNRTTKKIDMGAATNYGKDLGINSPTHRNTHSEDLFGSDDGHSKTTTTATKNNLDDIFEDTVDDFNPRANESAPPHQQADFGDFESAFGSNTTSHTATVKATPIIPAAGNDFADFSTAFTTNNPASQSTAGVELENSDNFLFCSSQSSNNQQTNSTNNNLLSADLFGNSVITSAFTSPTVASGNNDLLSDFGDLTLHTAPQGEFNFL